MIDKREGESERVSFEIVVTVAGVQATSGRSWGRGGGSEG